MRQILLNIFLAIIFLIAVGGLFSVKTEGRRDYFANDNIETEKQYIDNIKDLLEGYGVYDPGITMTKVSEDGTFTEYTVKIHTRKPCTKEMADSLDNVPIGISDCSVEVIFE